MPRRVEDIVRSDRRSIRDIPVADDRPLIKPNKADLSNKTVSGSGRPIPIHRLKMPAPEPELASKRPSSPRRNGGRKWFMYTLIVVALVAGAGYFASENFSRASFHITPVIIPISADATIVATAVPTNGYITYELARFSASASTTLPATDGPTQSVKASGRVTIYNSYAAQAQTLIAGTRLGYSGRVYRLTSTVTVPGYKTAANGTVTPGSITVSVLADAAGAEYNISRNTDPVEFDIVAYRGTPRDGKMYARAATDISGGFVGRKKNVDQTQLTKSTEELQSILKARLLAQAKASVPDGYILYDSAYKASFSSAEISGTEPNSATISITGVIHSVMFRTEDIAAKLAGSEKILSFGDFEYDSPGIESLSFSITNPDDFSPSIANTLIAKLKGEMNLVGRIPTEELKTKLAGLPLTETRDILLSYRPIIDLAKSSGEIFPSWVTAVPEDIGRISVTVLTK